MKMRLALFICALAVATPQLQAQSAEAQKGFQPVSAALHVHSRFSNGEYDILELASFAQQRKIDVLGITDSFLTRVRYGVGPFKKLMSRTMSRPAVLDRGLGEYLDSFERAQKQFDGLVLMPGVETAPSYYWEGRWPGELTLHDFDRHILVFGMRDREAIRNLPVIENATWANTNRTWSCAVGPAIALLIGTLLILRASRAGRLAGSFIILIGTIWMYDAYPFGTLSSPYSGKSDHSSFQRLIDYVENHGGITYWSHPEGQYPDLQVTGARVRMIKKAEPESLRLTNGYRGFEGLYGENITITKPGSLWDGLLQDYTRGGSRTWPSVITGIDFHSFKPGNGWYQLDRGLTVLYARDKQLDAVLDALKNARGYASFHDSAVNNRIVIDDFALRSNGNTAISGETLATSGAIDFSVNVRWMDSSNVPAESPLADIQLIRDGELLEKYQLALPASISRRDNLGVGHHYYRVAVQHRGTQILSNPIFCKVTD